MTDKQRQEQQTPQRQGGYEAGDPEVAQADEYSPAIDRGPSPEPDLPSYTPAAVRRDVERNDPDWQRAGGGEGHTTEDSPGE